jgi:hypothetical protein
VVDRSAVVGVGHFRVEEEECCQWEEEAVGGYWNIAAAEHSILCRSVQVVQQVQEVHPCFLGSHHHIQVQSSQDIRPAEHQPGDRRVFVAMAQTPEELHSHSALHCKSRHGCRLRVHDPLPRVQLPRLDQSRANHIRHDHLRGCAAKERRHR